MCLLYFLAKFLHFQILFDSPFQIYLHNLLIRLIFLLDQVMLKELGVIKFNNLNVHLYAFYVMYKKRIDILQDILCQNGYTI